MYEIIIDGQRKVADMIRHFGHNFNQMAENLRLIGNRMILLNPVMVNRSSEVPSNGDMQKMRNESRQYQVKIVDHSVTDDDGVEYSKE